MNQSLPRLVYLQRIGGNVVRLFFTDGKVSEVRLPIDGRPKRLQIEKHGMGLRFASGSWGERSAWDLYHSCQTERVLRKQQRRR